MALMYPFHVAGPPLSWAEHLWLPEISLANESFYTTVFEHRQAAVKNHDLLRHVSDNVAAIQHEEEDVENGANKT